MTNYEKYFGTPEKLAEALITNNMIDHHTHVYFAQYMGGSAPEHLEFNNRKEFVEWLNQEAS